MRKGPLLKTFDSLRSIEDYAKAAKRLNKGELFPAYLLEAGYRLVERSENLYSNEKTGQDIELTKTENDQICYRNLNNSSDAGNFLQFIQNRVSTIDQVVVSSESVTFRAAVTIGVYFENRQRVQTASQKQQLRREEKRRNRGLH